MNRDKTSEADVMNHTHEHQQKSNVLQQICTTERYCLLHVVVQGTREFPRSVNFSLRRMVAELWGVKLAKFPDFGLFFLYKTPKTHIPVTSLQARGYIAK